MAPRKEGPARPTEEGGWEDLLGDRTRRAPRDPARIHVSSLTDLPGPLASLHENALASLLAELSQELEGFGRGESLDHRRDAPLARAACHASVRANDSLAEDEAQALIAALDATDFGARCAHGRPVVAEWPAGEIEKRFGRDYASHAHAVAPESL